MNIEQFCNKLEKIYADIWDERLLTSSVEFFLKNLGIQDKTHQQEMSNLLLHIIELVVIKREMNAVKCAQKFFQEAKE